MDVPAVLAEEHPLVEAGALAEELEGDVPLGADCLQKRAEQEALVVLEAGAGFELEQERADAERREQEEGVDDRVEAQGLCERAVELCASRAITKMLPIKTEIGSSSYK